MKIFAVVLCLVAIAASSFASDERSAAKIVKKYSEAVACSITEVQYQKNQYKTVKVFQFDKDSYGMGDVFVVYWEGDVGCLGGNGGSVVPNFTVAEQNGLTSVTPVVVTDYKFPKMAMVRLTSFSGNNGQLQISGLAYGPNDRQGEPNKKVSYTLKLDQPNRAFVLVNT
jgi:hypothetical protein